jgi:hypothetical protein
VSARGRSVGVIAGGISLADVVAVGDDRGGGNAGETDARDALDPAAVASCFGWRIVETMTRPTTGRTTPARIPPPTASGRTGSGRF